MPSSPTNAGQYVQPRLDETPPTAEIVGLLDGLRLRPFGRREWLVLAALTFGGALLRLLLHFDRPFVGDEIGTLQLMQLGPVELLSSWQSWQTVHFFLFFERCITLVLGDTSPALQLLPMSFGILAIPLSGVAARTALTSSGALVVAFLVAVSPYLVDQAGVIRPYSAVTALSLAVMVALAGWLSQPTWGRGASFGACSAGLVLMQPLMLLPLLVIAGLVAYEAGRTLRLRSVQPWPPHLHRLALPTAFAAVIVMIAYRPVFNASDQKTWTEPGDVAGRFEGTAKGLSLIDLEWVWADYFASYQLAWPSLLLFLLGSAWAFREQSPVRGFVVLTLGSLLIFSWFGPNHYPWAYSRWLTFLLPWLLLPIALAIVRLAGSARHRWFTPTLAALIGLTWAPNLAESFRQKKEEPWDSARALISARPNDLVVAADWSTAHNLYISAQGPEVLHLGRIYPLRMHSQSRPGGAILLVLRGVDPECGDPILQTGRIHISAIPNRGGNLRTLRKCLVSAVERHQWPTTADWTPIYKFLEQTAKGDNPVRERGYAEMRETTEELSNHHRYRSSSRRLGDAREARKRVLSRIANHSSQ